MKAEAMSFGHLDVDRIPVNSGFGKTGRLQPSISRSSTINDDASSGENRRQGRVGPIFGFGRWTCTRRLHPETHLVNRNQGPLAPILAVLSAPHLGDALLHSPALAVATLFGAGVLTS